jgi:dolichol-phosphate mannosyltransferase
VLPVLNEEQAIGPVIDELLQNGYDRILVVDGYSSDSTTEVAERKGVAVIQQHGKGKAGAIRTAIDQVVTPYLLVMDGDCTYNPGDIERFLEHANGYDEIIGARQSDNISRLHRVGNRWISALFNILFGTSVSDVCSGMYLIKSQSAKELVLNSTGFSVEVETLAQTALHGRVTEIPIAYRNRVGEPKLSTWVHGFDIVKSIFLLARHYNPVFVFSLLTTLAAIPGSVVMLWVFALWMKTGVFNSSWALAGSILLLFSAQAFVIASIAIMLKRAEIRIERLIRTNPPTLQSSA